MKKYTRNIVFDMQTSVKSQMRRQCDAQLEQINIGLRFDVHRALKKKKQLAN